MTEKDKEINELRRTIAERNRRIGQLERRIRDLQARDYNSYQDGAFRGRLGAYEMLMEYAQNKIIETKDNIKRIEAQNR